jgi:hypothetical protein
MSVITGKKFQIQSAGTLMHYKDICGHGKQGEQIDPESGKHHLAHALCCLMFLYEHDTIYSIDK